ncbi:MAG: hypothetical protein DMF86_07405, partial [Acidobacteria bacterium]
LDVTPTTDDRPFFFHTTRLRNLAPVAAVLRLIGRPVQRPVSRDAWGTGGLTALLVLLALSVCLVALFIVAPLAVFIAMNWGFSVTLLSGGALYGAAAALTASFTRSRSS